jgi:type III secretion system YscQ/HrcQ family protein
MSSASFFEFQGLESYTRPEASLSNWCQQFLGSLRDWKSWIKDAWGDLLLEPAGWEIGLLQTHSVEAHGETRRYSFKQREIRIGRDASNDVVLDTVSAGKHHARIFVEQGRCFVEDLGSSLGTYCNQEPIAAHQRRLLYTDDQIAIFPHLLTVSLRQLWSRQLDVSVYAGAAESMTWREFQNTSTSARTNFAISIHPIGATLYLEVGRAFLMDFADRLLRPSKIAAEPSSILGPTDRAFLEFMILCLIERANRDLRFPFRFEAVAKEARSSIETEAKGVCATSSVCLLAATGPLRLFVPYAAIESMRRAVPAAPSQNVPLCISWKFPVSLGAADLSAEELASIERNDVLIFEPGMSLLLPRRFDCGWKATGERLTSLRAVSCLDHLQIDKYFERDVVSTEESPIKQPLELTPVPDLSQLPVSIHVILTEKELTLPDAAGLTSGAILDLDCDKSGTVLLAVNGKVLGDGRLVEIEGRLGVKILSWRGA